MKTILKLLFLSGIIVITAFSCIKGPTVTAPGLAVYKTKGDYFNYVSVTIDNGNIIFKPDYHNPRNNSIDYRITITEDDTIYSFRAKLISGYIISEEISDNSIFVDFTFKEYVIYEINHPEEGGVAENALLEHILDDNPFLELYIDRNKPRKYELSDTAEINQIIRNGELKKYFKRVK